MLFNGFYRGIAMLLCISLVIYAEPLAFGTAFQEEAPEAAAKLPNDQLDSLVAPVALYPDPLLSQVLVASTYPLEIVQLSQWMQKNSSMGQDKMVEAVKKENWDPSVQALVAMPDLVKKLSDNIKWTTDIGNAFLAQQGDVMDAVQRMRMKAKDKGNLKTSEQQKVETKVVENKTVVVIEPAKPDVVYVPSYEPTVVYGAPAYPYPVYSYPPPGYYAAGAAISFGVGMMVGAAWGGGGWGWNAGWGGNNNVTINNSNNFVNNSNRQNVNKGGNRNQVNAQGKSNWQHNPQHRGGAPYSDRATASKFGGTSRGDSMSTRQANARQQQARADRGGSNRGDISSRGEGFAGGNRASANTRDAGNRGGGGGDRIGNQSVSRDSGSKGSAFGGGGSNRASASASSSRGASSMGRSSGGGGRSGGGRRR